MLEKGATEMEARKKLEEVEEFIEYGKIKSLPPAELRYLMEDYEHLRKQVALSI